MNLPQAEVLSTSKVTNRSDNKAKIRLLRLYGAYLPSKSVFTKNDRFILALPEGFKHKEEATTRAKSIFRFESTKTPSDELKEKLEETKDSLISAIQSSYIGLVDKLIKRYLSISESYLEEMYKFGAIYSSKQAIEERSNIFNQWDETKMLNHDLLEIMEIASGSRNRQIVGTILYLPMAISSRALQAKDHLLFQQFIGFIPYIYNLSKRADNSLKSFIVDLSWRYLKKLCNFKISYKIREVKEDELSSYEDFAIYTIKIFQDLMKEMINNKDWQELLTVISEFKDVYDDYSIPSSIEKITEAKHLICFSICSCLLDEIKNDPENNLLRSCFQSLKDLLPNDLPTLAKLLYVTHDHDKQTFYGWNGWEIIADGKAHFIDVTGKFDRFFCIVSLQILEKEEESLIKRIILPHDGEYRGVSNSLIKILEDVNTTPYDWMYILTEEQIAESEELISLLKLAKKGKKQRKISI